MSNNHHIKPNQLHDESMTKLGAETRDPDNPKFNDMTPEGEETPFENPDDDLELMERQHPNPRVNHLICLISLFQLAYGIYMISYSCGDRYIALIVLGIIGLFLGLSSFYRRAIKDNRYQIFYYLKAFYFLVLGVVTLCYLIMIKEQAYCDAQWCHKQVDTQDYFQYLNNQVGEAKLDEKCTELNSQYTGDILQEAIGQYIVDNMRIYCAREKTCVDSTDLYSKIYWHNIDLTRGLLIVMGIIEIIYVFWIIYWINVIRPKELEEYEFMMKHDLAQMPNHPLALKQRELYLQQHERWKKKRLEIEKQNQMAGGPTQRSIWAMEETHTPPNGISRQQRPGNPVAANPLTVKTKDQVILPPSNNNQPLFRPVPVQESSPVQPLLKPFNDPTRVQGGFGGGPSNNRFGGGPGPQNNGFGGPGPQNNGFGGGFGGPQNNREPNFGDKLIRQQNQVPIDDTQHQMMKSMNRGFEPNNTVKRGPPMEFKPKV